MTGIDAICRALGALAKLGGYMAAYLLGRNHKARREAERVAKNAREANRIDEDVRHLSDADLYDELRRE